jgi:hypothetical protein
MNLFKSTIPFQNEIKRVTNQYYSIKNHISFLSFIQCRALSDFKRGLDKNENLSTYIFGENSSFSLHILFDSSLITKVSDQYFLDNLASFDFFLKDLKITKSLIENKQKLDLIRTVNSVDFNFYIFLNYNDWFNYILENGSFKNSIDKFDDIEIESTDKIRNEFNSIFEEYSQLIEKMEKEKRDWIF